MELSELTNKELKYILRQNNVKNYSKLNKKDLVKKVNQLIKAQNGGNNKKKNKLNELIGGAPSEESLLSENQREEINQRNINSSKSRGNNPPEIPPQPQLSQPQSQLSQPQSQSPLSQTQPQQQLPTPLPPAPGPPPPSPFPSAPPFNIRRNNSQNPVPPNSSQNPVQTNSSKNTVPPKPKSCDMCLIQ